MTGILWTQGSEFTTSPFEGGLRGMTKQRPVIASEVNAMNAARQSSGNGQQMK
ncbi:MAG: hypothetical protein U5K69_07610 [Balneolaceae bacterium]|nr:hypothetical protein [Balneolaceae bacterium]